MMRRIVVGVLGLLLAVVWLIALVHQRHNVEPLTALVGADVPIYPLKLSASWSLLQLGMTGVMLMPLALASFGALVGMVPTFKVLRVVVVLGGALSLGTFIIYASVVAPIVTKGGGPVFPYGDRIGAELVAAGCALALQVGLGSLVLPSRRFALRAT